MTEAVLAGRSIQIDPSAPRRRVLVGVLCLLAATLTAGCLDMEQSVVVNRDLTGKAGFKMSMSLEPFMNQMVAMIGKSGASGPPPVDFIDQMKQEMMAQFGKGMVDVEILKKNLPAGVTVMDATQNLDGLTVSMTFNFAFTDITKLPDVALMPGPRIGGTDAKPFKPFEELEFKDEGATVVIATKATPPAATDADPKAGAANAAGIAALMDSLKQPEMKEMIEGMRDAMKGLRVAIRIETPLTVTEHNAPTKVGAAMVWEEKLDQSPPTAPDANPFYLKPMSVLVKIKK